MPTIQAEHDYATQIHLRLPTSLRRAIEQCAKRLGINSSALIRMAVVEFIERQQTKT